MKTIKEQQLKAALNEVALLKAKLNELGLTKSSKSMEKVVHTTALEIADLLKNKQLLDFRTKLNADVDAILRGRPSREKTLWDTPAAKKLVKGLKGEKR